MNMRTLKRGLSTVLGFSVTVTIFSGALVFGGNNAKTVVASENYGLQDKIDDGTILHCFDWKYNDIKNSLPEIAKAGFTSVQTSPAQPEVKSGVWYWLYQPLGFYVGSNDLGSENDLRDLCNEADKYGIKVVVDVVANHLAGDHTNIDPSLKGWNSWHNYGQVHNWGDRYQVTHGEIGMPDLNSEDSFVENKVAGYVDELKNDGVDGIRWDAAKHIGLPSEGCNFWPVVTKDGLYNYGEILVGPDDSGSHDNLMKEYENYISVTDSDYGSQIRNAFNGGNAPSTSGNWSFRGISNDKLVYWAESHDTYANDDGDSKNISQNVIDRAYAVAASHNDSPALYFSRPYSTNKNSIIAGQKGSTHFTSAEVAAVNHFHNALEGEKDYYGTYNNVSVSTRKDGAILVMGRGNGYVDVKNYTTDPGVYSDEITGHKFTVTKDSIKGEIGNSGIAVFYKDDKPDPKPVPDPTPVPTPTPVTDKNVAEIALPSSWGINGQTTVYCYAYDSATERTNNGSWPGQKMTYDSTKKIYTYEVPVSIKKPRVIFYVDGNHRDPQDGGKGFLLDTNGTWKYENGSWSKQKEEDTHVYPVEDGCTAYIDIPSDWGIKGQTTVYCYAYDSATERINNGGWPGQKMTYSKDTGLYMYKIPSDIKAPRVIFYVDGSHRNPQDGGKGFLFSQDGSFIYRNGSWSRL